MKRLIPILAMTFASQTFAYDLANKFGIGAGIGLPIPVFGNRFNDVANHETAFSAYGRFHLTSSSGFDLGVSRAEFKDTSMNFRSIDLIAFWRTAGTSDITPILGIGAGVTSIKDYEPKSAKLSVYGRVGGEFGIMPALALNALVDYQYVSKLMGKMPTGSAHIFTPKIALTLYFGGESNKEETKEVIKEAEAEARKEEIKEAVVETKKEEVKEAVKEAMAEEKAEQAEQAETPKDIVSVKSAATIRPIEMSVEFDSNTSEIKSDYQNQLKLVADQLKENPELKGVIQGFSDDIGPKKLNNQLAKERADAVRAKLLEYGVSEERLNTNAFGEEKPVATNKTGEGRQKNRRVSIEVVPTKL
jgi:outer membrane protein OmpA-like peptidoglycan-associated protein